MTDTNDILIQPNTERSDGEKTTKTGLTNFQVLAITTVLFGGFVVAEIIGALASGSLSLLGDASAMAVDVFTYFSNMYAEHVKAKQGFLDKGTKRILEVYVPCFSVCALLGVTGYVTSDAMQVIIDGDGGDDVNVYFMYAFAAANFLVDVFSVGMFYFRGKEVFENEEFTIHAPIRTFSLDGTRNISFDQKAIQAAEEGGQKSSATANLNMLSAFTHVGGDSLRTASVFIAAVVNSTCGVDSSTCDAYAAIVVSITIVMAVIPLCREIYKAALRDF